MCPTGTYLHYGWCRCFVSANCTTPGRFLNTATNQCEMCPVGTYNSQWWVESCTDCPSGFTTKTTGMATSTRCYRTWDRFRHQQFLNLHFQKPSLIGKISKCMRGKDVCRDFLGIFFWLWWWGMEDGMGRMCMSGVFFWMVGGGMLILGPN